MMIHCRHWLLKVAMTSVVNISTLDRYYHNQQPGDDDDDANEEPFYELVKQPVHLVVIYTLAYAAVFLLAVTGNVLVILVVCRNSSMHNVTNYFIVNLAVADLLVGLLCLPITLVANLISGESAAASLVTATAKIIMF